MAPGRGSLGKLSSRMLHLGRPKSHGQAVASSKRCLGDLGACLLLTVIDIKCSSHLGAFENCVLEFPKKALSDFWGPNIRPLFIRGSVFSTYQQLGPFGLSPAGHSKSLVTSENLGLR